MTNLSEELGIAVGNPPIEVAVLDADAPNAMAVGRGRASTTVVVTTGLLETLTRDELEAVLAVEQCAIRRLDTALRTVLLACTHTAVSTHHELRTMSSRDRPFWLVVITWPTMVVAETIRRWTMRSDDFAADDMAVLITRNPEGLRRALERLEGDNSDVPDLVPAATVLWFEPLTRRP